MNNVSVMIEDFRLSSHPPSFLDVLIDTLNGSNFIPGCLVVLWYYSVKATKHDSGISYFENDFLHHDRGLSFILAPTPFLDVLIDTLNGSNFIQEYYKRPIFIFQIFFF